MKNSSSRLIFLKNEYLITGIVLVLFVLSIGLLSFTVNPKMIELGSCPPERPPSPEYILGTDSLGRDIFSCLTLGVLQSLIIGTTAGTFGIIISIIFAFISGYKGGKADALLRSIIDTFLVIPLWPLLIILRGYLGSLNTFQLGLLLAAFSWPGAARAMRSQVLSLKERDFVNLAWVSGESDLEIIFKELMPNLLPYVGVSFAQSFTWSIVSEVGLELVGLGPAGSMTLGLIIYYALSYGAMTSGLWWWIFPPIICIILLLIGLQLINIGLDQIYNPRLRRITGL
ncbi:ABC transporter permease [Candidatus Bathyarchaeota archaeon]|nr:MAG: ABC transporter permease [Candidatus Bathyarchaeota archaeon]